MYGDIKEVIGTDRDYFLEINNLGVACLLEDTRDRFGRPRLAVDKTEIERLYDIHLSWEKVADILDLIKDITKKKDRVWFGCLE